MLPIKLSNQSLNSISNYCRANFPASSDTHPCTLSTVALAEKNQMRGVGFVTLIKDFNEIFSTSQSLFFRILLLNH